MAELVRLTRGVWRSSDSLTDVVARCAAMLSVLPPGSVLAGITAARLHGLWLPPPGEFERVEVALRTSTVRAREHAGCSRPEFRARRRDIGEDEVTLARGLPVTTEARTWVDLAEVLSIADLVAAGDSVLRGGTTEPELVRAVYSAVGRRGVKRARFALDHLDARSRSRPESHVRFALVSGGLPKPAVNRAIHNEHGGWLAEPDLHYRRARLAIEYNGAHHAGIDQMRYDIDRGFDVTSDDWMMLVCGPKQAFQRTDQLVSTVTFLLDRRDPGWRGRPSE